MDKNTPIFIFYRLKNQNYNIGRYIKHFNTIKKNELKNYTLFIGIPTFYIILKIYKIKSTQNTAYMIGIHILDLNEKNIFYVLVCC